MKRQQIDVLDAVRLFHAYSITAEVFNHYQLRLYDIESGNMWDWYHTTGSLVSYYDAGSKQLPKKERVIKNTEDVAIFIREREDMVK